MNMLADGKPHAIEELDGLRLSKQKLTAALQQLAAEEKIVSEDGKIRSKG